MFAGTVSVLDVFAAMIREEMAPQNLHDVLPLVRRNDHPRCDGLESEHLGAHLHQLDYFFPARRYFGLLGDEREVAEIDDAGRQLLPGELTGPIFH